MQPLGARATAVDRDSAVWFRPHKRKPWALVGTAATHRAAVNLIGAGGRHNGDWLVTDRPGVTADAKRDEAGTLLEFVT